MTQTETALETFQTLGIGVISVGLFCVLMVFGLALVLHTITKFIQLFAWPQEPVRHVKTRIIRIRKRKATTE